MNIDRFRDFQIQILPSELQELVLKADRATYCIQRRGKNGLGAVYAKYFVWILILSKLEKDAQKHLDFSTISSTNFFLALVERNYDEIQEISRIPKYDHLTDRDHFILNLIYSLPCNSGFLENQFHSWIQEPDYKEKFDEYIRLCKLLRNFYYDPHLGYVILQVVS